MNAPDPCALPKPRHWPPMPTRPGTERIVPALTDYIAVPAKSPMFDADWAEHGHIERVVRDAAAWVEGRKVAGLKLEVVRCPAARR
jgi:hypothetical protein